MDVLSRLCCSLLLPVPTFLRRVSLLWFLFPKHFLKFMHIVTNYMAITIFLNLFLMFSFLWSYLRCGHRVPRASAGESSSDAADADADAVCHQVLSWCVLLRVQSLPLPHHSPIPSLPSLSFSPGVDLNLLLLSVYATLITGH